MKKLLMVFIVLLFVAGSSNAQIGKMSVGGNLIVSLPMGDFGTVYKTGFGGTATFSYRVINELDLTGTLGYISWGVKEDGFSGSFSSVPLLFGARYFFNAGQIKPYATAELGFHFASSSFDIPSYNIGGFSYGGGSTSISSTDFGFGIGGGIQVPIGDKLNFDGTLQYNIISTTGSSSGFVSVEAGVAYGLN